VPRELHGRIYSEAATLLRHNVAALSFHVKVLLAVEEELARDLVLARHVLAVADFELEFCARFAFLGLLQIHDRGAQWLVRQLYRANASSSLALGAGHDHPVRLAVILHLIPNAREKDFIVPPRRWVVLPRDVVTTLTVCVSVCLCECVHA
jgi:hypothetical protein